MPYAFRVYCTVIFRTFFPGDNKLARWSLKRFCVMVLFIPMFTALEAFHWLCLSLDYVLFPGFRRVNVASPLFIVGVPRSGTTFLHRLIAKDSEQFTSMRTWELLFAPAICEKIFWIGLWKLDRRIGKPFNRCLRYAERIVFRQLDDVHHVSLDAAEEDFIALAPMLGCFLLVLPFPYQEVWNLAYFDSALPQKDRESVMAFYNGIVKRHLYVYGQDKRYLSKNPSFTPMIHSLRETFPDATIVANVRNPEKAIPSLLNSMIEGAAIFDLYLKDGEFQNRLIQKMFHYFLYVAGNFDCNGESAGLIVDFTRLCKAPRTTIKNIYGHSGYPYTEAYDLILATEEAKARTYKSCHHYSLEQFGLNPEDIRSELCDVYGRFSFSDSDAANAA